MEIYIIRNGQERGPFDRPAIDRMLLKGSIQPSDQAWHEGMPDWAALQTILEGRTPAPAPSTIFRARVSPPPTRTPSRPPAELATAKQKAFLSYMGVHFAPGLTKEEAVHQVNDLMENAADPARLARWSEERLRLHPELFAADLQARKENRPSFYYDRVLQEGAEYFQEVSKAHCQVLVGYLDVKFPNWDARESEAVKSYFFPALAEKFPQLVRKAWRGRLKYPSGPRVAPELHGASPEARSISLPARTPLRRALLAGVLLVIVGSISLLVLWPQPMETPRAPQQGPSPTPQAASLATPAPLTEVPATPRRKKLKNPAVVEVDPLTGEKMGSNPGATPPLAATTPKPLETGPPPLFTPPPKAPVEMPLSATPAPATPRTMVTLTKPVEVQVSKYGRLTLPTGTKLRIAGQEGRLVKVYYMDSVVAVPVSSTNLEP